VGTKEWRRGPAPIQRAAGVNVLNCSLNRQRFPLQKNEKTAARGMLRPKEGDQGAVGEDERAPIQTEGGGGGRKRLSASAHP